MKNIIYSLLISVTCITCSAQTRLTPGEIKGKHETFIIKLIQPLPNDTQKLWVVSSKSNKYNNGIHSPQNRILIPMDEKKDVHVNNDTIKLIIYQILNNKLNALKTNKDVVGLIFIFKPNGRLTDIVFSMHSNTLITLQEIEEIDKQLRAHIKATFTRKYYLQYEAINYYPPDIIF